MKNYYQLSFRQRIGLSLGLMAFFYSFLLKIRFADKFDLRIRVSGADMDQYKIAPLTLQLLVENAVKHNRISLQQPLLVEICAEGDILMVRNRSVWAGESEEAFVVKVPLLR